MSIVREYKETIKERAQREPEFASALLDEAVTLFLNGEPKIARLILRDLAAPGAQDCHSKHPGQGNSNAASFHDHLFFH